MGYRLEISKVEYVNSGGKLYGYVDDETQEKLKSYQWLIDHEYMEGTEFFDYGFSYKFVLCSDEFREFIELYIEDKVLYGNAYMDTDAIIKELREIAKTDYTKLVEFEG